jgi:hypothetical protein
MTTATILRRAPPQVEVFRGCSAPRVCDGVIIEYRKEIAEIATGRKLPTIFAFRQNVEGGLMS